MKTNLTKSLWIFSFLLAMFFACKSNAQIITVGPADMTWGWYWKGTTANFDYTKEDLVEQLIYDKGLYFCGRTASAGTNATSPECSGVNFNFADAGDAGDAYLSFRDPKYLCNPGWTSYMACSTATEYAYCVAEDKVLTKKFFYTAGEISSTSAFVQQAKSCVGGNIYQDYCRSDNDDGFIAKYDVQGRLIRWTYFGGTRVGTDLDAGRDIILGIVVDQTSALHDVYVTGYTESTTDLWQNGVSYYKKISNSIKDKGDIFIAQFDSALSTLKFFTYYGGTDVNSDRPHGISIANENGSKYLVIAGSTESTLGFYKDLDPTFFPVWDKQYGTNGLNGSIDGFLMKWNSMANLSLGPLWCTYFGGKDADRVRKTLIMPDNTIYMVGETKSKDDGGKFHTTINDALQPNRDLSQDANDNYKPFYDGFISKFSANGTSLLSFTFFGGNGDDHIKDINLFHSNPNANNNSDSIAITGITTSTDLALTTNTVIPVALLSANAGSVSSSLHGASDAFFAVITGTGATQIPSFSCYVGGTSTEDENLSYGPAIALGINGAEHIAFATNSSGIDVTCLVNVQTDSYNGGSDVYIGTIYPFLEHYGAPCPTCNPCRLDGSEFSVDQQLEFYPVPFNNEVNLSVSAEQNGEAIIRVYNSIGDEILMQKISVMKGDNFTTLNFQGQAAGIYLTRIEIDNKIETAKIIKE